MASTVRSPIPTLAPFSIDDDSDDSDTQALITARSSPAPVPVPSTSTQPYSDHAPLVPSSPPPDETSYYPPVPLKSNIPSREAAFEADDDLLDEEDLDPAEPLLMQGLLKTSAARRGSLDVRVKEYEEGNDEPPDWLTKGAGVLAGVANMSNSILGAGIIGEWLTVGRKGLKADCGCAGLPYALREAGFFSGLILLVVLGVVTDWTIRLIVLNAKMSGRNTYIDIMDACASGFSRLECSRR